MTASFSRSAVSDAPPEEVFKLLYDPGRFREWWGMPADFPLPQVVGASADRGSVVISCLRLDATFEWTLAGLGAGTRIEVAVRAPGEVLPAVSDVMASAVHALARLAERETA